MSYQANKRWLDDLRQRIPHYVAHVVGSLSGEEAVCQGPQYRLWEWACAVIFDRQYAPGVEPIQHWRFNVIGRPGTTVIVTPIFEPLVVRIEANKQFRRKCPDWSHLTDADEAEMHAMFHGSSNWCATFDCLLHVVAERQPIINGYFEDSDHCYIHLPDKHRELAQAVLDSLWAAVHGDPRAFVGAKHCAFCGHALTDALSSARGYGPDCCEKYGLPKTPAAVPPNGALPAPG